MIKNTTKGLSIAIFMVASGTQFSASSCECFLRCFGLGNDDQHEYKPIQQSTTSYQAPQQTIHTSIEIYTDNANPNRTSVVSSVTSMNEYQQKWTERRNAGKIKESVWRLLANDVKGKALSEVMAQETNPDAEFHVKSSNAHGCNLQITINNVSNVVYVDFE
jgi:hypothetical protein